MKKWLPYQGGSAVGEIGSEDGMILYDEEFDDACRITMERCQRYYAITCGVYGSMVHTVFRGANEVKETYEAMKRELGDFIRRSVDADEASEFYEHFCERYT